MESKNLRLLWVVKAIVFFDFLGVAFVVPLMQTYFTDANITGSNLHLLHLLLPFIISFFWGLIRSITWRPFLHLQRYAIH